jgi:hypothetical protein
MGEKQIENTYRPMQPPTVTAPPISEEVRDELTAIMQELLLKTHELSFEYSTMDCPDIQKCPLAQKSRELFKVVKDLNKLVRQVAPPTTKPTYVK